MATQLGIYNDVLALLGESPVASLTSPRMSRRALDDVWTGVKQGCLEQAIWNFAIKSTSIAQGGAGVFGILYRFAKPADLVHLFTASLSSTHFIPLGTDEFYDDGIYWSAQTTPLYVRYTSNDAAYGFLLSTWPQSYTTYVTAALAKMACLRITGNPKLLEILAQYEEIVKEKAISIESISFLPGKLPFNQQARTLLATQSTQPDPLPFIGMPPKREAQ